MTAQHARPTATTVPALLAVATAFLVASTRASAYEHDPVAACAAAIAATLDSRVADALSRVDGTGRRLLALRSYLRSRAHLAERWSWDDQQIAAYEQSPEYRDLQAQVDRVRQALTQANPGYVLWVNPQVRSLDIHIEHWNTNQSVTEAAANLLAAARALVASERFPASKPEDARKAMESFLSTHVPAPTPTIAAPGLSPHGQMRAIDFQVEKDGRIVAGAKTATLATDWDEAGWTARLEAAVRSASSHFVGPLTSPREPWHYTYTPESVAAR